MTKAEEKAVEYQIKAYGPNVMGGASMLSEEEYMRFNMNLDFKNGYEQAEKDTLDRICKWLEEHAIRGMRDGATAYHQGKIALITDLRDWINGED